MGKVGIGTNTPTTGSLHVDATSLGIFCETTSTGSAAILGNASSEFGFSKSVEGRTQGVNRTGVRGVSAHSTGVNYGVLGLSNSPSGYDFYASGLGINYGSSSSIRWKSNVVNINNPLDKLAQLRGVYYDWDEDHGGQHAIGMIAEEVGKALPEIVGYEENGIDAIGMDYSMLTPLLVEAMNALRAEKDVQIKQLNDENQLLKARLDRLERMMVQIVNN